MRARAARRRRKASSGLTSQPSTPQRRARGTSAGRSSSSRIGASGVLPSSNSCSRFSAVAMPPMLPICMSSTISTGSVIRAASLTSRPSRTRTTRVSSSDSAASTSSKIQSASVAISTSGTVGQATSRALWSASGRWRNGPRKWIAVAARTATIAGRGVPGGEFVLDIQVDEADSYTVCRPVGELDAYTVGQFRDALGELADKRYLLIDLSSVPFMDSAGLGALIGGIRRAREAGGDVAVACSRPTLTRLLHTTGFDRIVPVKETVEAAAAALDDAAASIDE